MTLVPITILVSVIPEDKKSPKIIFQVISKRDFSSIISGRHEPLSLEVFEIRKPTKFLIKTMIPMKSIFKNECNNLS